MTPPARARADIVVPEASFSRLVVSVWIGLLWALTVGGMSNLRPGLTDDGVIRWGFTLIGPLVAGLEILVWRRHRAVQLDRFAAIVMRVRSTPVSKGRWKRVRPDHEAVLQTHSWWKRTYTVDAAVMRHLVEGDVGVAFVRAGRLVGFTPVREPDSADSPLNQGEGA